MNKKGILLLTLVLATGAVPAAAGQGMAVITGECPYILLDTDAGQVLLKHIDGPKPQVGDILEGRFKSKEFTTLSYPGKNAELKVWVDVVDNHGNRALSRHGRYCG